MPIRTVLPVVLRSAVVGAAFVLTGCGAPAVTTSAPAVQPRENVEGLLGRNILFLEPEEQLLAYRNADLLAPTRPIPAGGDPYPLPSAPVELSSVTYVFNDSTRALADLAERTNLTGLLVIREGEIVLEEYFRGNTAETRWTSFSVAKSVVSLLFGAAIRDGYIESVEEPVTRYLPELAGSAYEGVTIRQILQMSSGVAWNEDYADPESDVARLGQLSEGGGIQGLLAYMGQLPRSAPVGARYNYSTGETHIAGAVLRAATGRTLSEYLSEKIWRPYGMESDGFWALLREGDVEHGGCCMSATLRDFGRLGMFVLDDGVMRDGTRVLPGGWIKESTAAASAFPGYGYFWWRLPDHRFFGVGIFGQYLHIDPRSRLVVVMHSTWPQATSRRLTGHRQAWIDAVTAALESAGAAGAVVR